MILIHNLVEALVAPLLLCVTIVKQAGHLAGPQASPVIHLLFTGATIQAPRRFQFQLAGRIVAAVTDHAAFFLQAVGLLCKLLEVSHLLCRDRKYGNARYENEQKQLIDQSH
jgi:hypothetical protein